MNSIEGNKKIIRYITQTLREIDAVLYAQPLDFFKGSSIGQHFRHILDFYRCLLRDFEQGIVDYAHRERDPLAETNSDYTCQAFETILSQIDSLAEYQPLAVQGDFSEEGEAQRPLLHSSVGRELMFAHDHAVHHLAMIQVGLRLAAPQMSINEQLGVAPSTIKHRNGLGSR
ncbi:MAG TPA: hypothetical protein PKD70_00270 [Saprospiraceae bacterium]|nr:hypothetical protein [Saprospiraceae bacterium]HMP12279.1 hypothetical protein [Saprospiraceae bacterium]